MFCTLSNPKSGRATGVPSFGLAIQRPQRRGAVLVYVCVAMAAFACMASLAVDVAHAHLVKAQLQCAADAAARYAASGLIAGPSAAINNAVTAAGYNKADGTAVKLNTDSDVQLGTWDSSTGTFTVLTGSAASSATAVRVYARRVASSGNGVSLSFSSLLGKSTADVTAVSISIAKPGGYGIVGLKSISLSGGAIDSYWAPNGYTPGGSHGTIASNGNINLSGNSQIDGDAHPGPGDSVNNPAAVTGSTTPLAQAMYYPNASPTSYATSNNNSAVPSQYLSGSSFKMSSSQSLSLPGGVYYFKDFSMSGSSTLAFTGPATVYVYGALSLSGTTNTFSNLPGDLKFVVGPDTSGSAPGKVTLSGGSSLYAYIYAPQSDITVSGTGAIYGSLVGQSISSSGGASIHYDISLTGPGAISLVQ